MGDGVNNTLVGDITARLRHAPQQDREILLGQLRNGSRRIELNDQQITFSNGVTHTVSQGSSLGGNVPQQIELVRNQGENRQQVSVGFGQDQGQRLGAGGLIVSLVSGPSQPLFKAILGAMNLVGWFENGGKTSISEFIQQAENVRRSVVARCETASRTEIDNFITGAGDGPGLEALLDQCGVEGTGGRNAGFWQSLRELLTGEGENGVRDDIEIALRQHLETTIVERARQGEQLSRDQIRDLVTSYLVGTLLPGFDTTYHQRVNDELIALLDEDDIPRILLALSNVEPPLPQQMIRDLRWALSDEQEHNQQEFVRMVLALYAQRGVGTLLGMHNLGQELARLLLDGGVLETLTRKLLQDRHEN